jgi:hypothetical protein
LAESPSQRALKCESGVIESSINKLDEVMIDGCVDRVFVEFGGCEKDYL